VSEPGVTEVGVSEVGVSDVALVGDLTIYVAAEQRLRLIEALEATEHLRLDLSQVTEMDSAGLQLLLLLGREARLTGKRLELLGHSQAVLDVLGLAHLRPDLNSGHDIEQHDIDQQGARR
jgi:anti-sigma B factor antagonist